jgi:hypothetical protein
MAVTQLDEGNSFRAHHQGPRAFIIANAWDAGSARILAGVGFAALATSSGAAAGTCDRLDLRVKGGRQNPPLRSHAEEVVVPPTADQRLVLAQHLPIHGCERTARADRDDVQIGKRATTAIALTVIPVCHLLKEGLQLVPALQAVDRTISAQRHARRVN